MRVFNEVQRFNQWWLRLLNVGLVLFLVFSLFKWFVMKEPTGNVGPDDTTGQLVVLFSIVPVLILFYFMKMESSIDEAGVHYQFLPFHSNKKTVTWSEMQKCYVRKYNPIREYGGWGLRGSFGKNKAYNLKGNIGIQLQLKNEQKILLGTQRGTEAQQVIDRYYKRG